MKKRLHFLLAALSCVALTSGCDTLESDSTSSTSDDGRVAFTSYLRSSNRLNEGEIRGLQFYVHSTIVLAREVTDGDRSVVHGRLVSRSGKMIDEIELDADTPGVARWLGDDRMTVCFESGCAGTLLFGCPQSCTNGRYSLLADWSSNQGKLDYAGQTYWANESTYLEIDADQLSRLDKTRRVLPGVRLEEK